MSNHAPSELIKTVLSLNFVKGGGTPHTRLHERTI